MLMRTVVCVLRVPRGHRCIVNRNTDQGHRSRRERCPWSVLRFTMQRWPRGTRSTHTTVLINIAYWDARAPSYRWMQIAAQIVASENPAATLSTRAMSLVSVAIYDAT